MAGLWGPDTEDCEVADLLRKNTHDAHNGNMRIILAQMNPTIGDLVGNREKICHAIALARQQRADIVLFAELALCGYPPEDFLLLPHFCQAVEDQLAAITRETQGITAIVGTIRKSAGERELYNSAAILSDGKCVGYQDKVLLPAYNVFTERRYFEPGGPMRLWPIAGRRVAITICEDIWQHTRAVQEVSYSRDPVAELAPLKPDLLLNLSASPYSVGRADQRVDICRQASQTLGCPVCYCNQVGGNDSLIFDGKSLYVDARQGFVEQGAAFKEDALLVDTEKSISGQPTRSFDAAQDLYRALVLGVRDYFHKSGFQSACLGLSGGIDSAVVACIAAEALGPSNVLGVMMPSRFSSSSAMDGAQQLAESLGIQTLEVSIEEPFKAYLTTLEPLFIGRAWDATEENMQARIRGMILMALSNKFGHIVLATGNKSELAMGYATLYGDMCGGLGVISDLTKGQVYAVANAINCHGLIIPEDTIVRPPSAELRPNQKDSDSLPDYAIIDAVLQDYVEQHLPPDVIAERHQLPIALVLDLVQRIHRNEYKRRQSPPGLRVTQRAFSVGRRFPIVQKFV